MSMRVITVKEIEDFLVTKVNGIYLAKPLLIGGTPFGVDMKLYDYHEVWSHIRGCEREFGQARLDVQI